MKRKIKIPPKLTKKLTSILLLYIIVFTMLETPHVVLGAAIATKIPNPWIAIPLAFASHFVLEKVPHWNPHINTETKKYGHITTKSTVIIIIDSTLALATGSYIAWRAMPNTAHALTILAASLASILPDLIEAPYFYLKLKSQLIMKWIAFQKSIQFDTSLIPGLMSQALTILACFWWIRT